MKLYNNDTIAVTGEHTSGCTIKNNVKIDDVNLPINDCTTETRKFTVVMAVDKLAMRPHGIWENVSSQMSENILHGMVLMMPMLLGS